MVDPNLPLREEGISCLGLAYYCNGIYSEALSEFKPPGASLPLSRCRAILNSYGPGHMVERCSDETRAGQIDSVLYEKTIGSCTANVFTLIGSQEQFLMQNFESNGRNRCRG